MKSCKIVPHYSVKTVDGIGVENVNHRNIMIGIQESLIIFALVLLLFGACKLPELSHSTGKSTGGSRTARIESKKEMKEKFRGINE